MIFYVNFCYCCISYLDCFGFFWVGTTGPEKNSRANTGGTDLIAIANGTMAITKSTGEIDDPFLLPQDNSKA